MQGVRAQRGGSTAHGRAGAAAFTCGRSRGRRAAGSARGAARCGPLAATAGRTTPGQAPAASTPGRRPEARCRWAAGLRRVPAAAGPSTRRPMQLLCADRSLAGFLHAVRGLGTDAPLTRGTGRREHHRDAARLAAVHVRHVYADVALAPRRPSPKRPSEAAVLLGCSGAARAVRGPCAHVRTGDQQLLGRWVEDGPHRRGRSTHRPAGRERHGPPDLRLRGRGRGLSGVAAEGAAGTPGSAGCPAVRARAPTAAAAPRIEVTASRAGGLRPGPRAVRRHGTYPISPLGGAGRASARGAPPVADLVALQTRAGRATARASM